MSDDLFTPTITAPPVSAKSPWAVPSLVYPALVGGGLAVTVLGLINGRRLLVGGAGQAAVALVGIAAIAARIGVLATILRDRPESYAAVTAVAGVIVFVVVSRMQRRAFRAFERRGGEPARLLVPGLIAVVGAGGIEGAMTLAIVGLS